MREAMSEKQAATYTPGPWFSSPVQTADDGWQFCTVGPFEHHVEDAIAEVSGINYDCEANGRLIAAAPELLDALRGFLQSKVWRAVCDYEACGCETSQLFAAGERAIAKAEGR